MGRRLPPNKQSKGLKSESRGRTREHDSRREHCLQKSRLGIGSREGYYAPNVRADGIGATRFRLGPLPGSCMDKDVLGVFLARKRHCTKLLE